MEKYLFNFKVFERLAKQGNNVTKTQTQVKCVCVCVSVSLYVCLKLFFCKVRTSLNSIETIISLLASPKKEPMLTPTQKV